MSSSRVFKGCRALMSAAAKASSSATKKPTIKVSATGKTTTAATPATKKITGIQMVKAVSPQLSNFLGVPETSRSDATKRIWEHIKKNNLQAPEDKRIIVCDEKLKTIFGGKDKVGFLEIAKLLTPHFPKTATK